ncbi:Mov34/MPN/PAD-1 family protein [Acidobacteriota bacterium]
MTRPETCKKRLIVGPGVLASLIAKCRDVLPDQTYGVMAGPEPGFCSAYYLFQTNLRDKRTRIRDKFVSYGSVYRNPNRGFWVDPAEQLALLEKLEHDGLQMTGFFHTHRILDARPTAIDQDLHFHRNVPMIILSITGSGNTEVRAYQHQEDRWKPIEIVEMDSETGLTKAACMR